jgi:predicted TIM-barrel fold metal-dependent hydrolase
MTLTAERTTTEVGAVREPPLAVIDGDIHNAPKSNKSLSKYLPERWRIYHETFGGHGHSGAYYPRANLNAARTDSWPSSGFPPGSDLDFLRSQLLDEWGMEYGVLNPLNGAGAQLNLGYAEALCRAANDWQIEEWLDPEPRLRASIVVPWEDGELAAAEIDRRAGDRRFIQALIVARTSEPIGRRKYWKMFEALERNRLPLGIHFGGSGGAPITGAGWPSFYIEDHAGMPTSFETQVTSLVCEGIFERFPSLKIVLIEGGFGWLPPLMWRLDNAWKKLRAEVPHLQRLPSEYIREHFWITTQPMEEPTKPRHFLQLLEHLNMPDRLMFATDYPHWDFDAPDHAIPTKLDPELERSIMAGNARALYGLH